jgi:hypothetical protein
VQQLRLLCRDEVALIEQRTALINQLQQALYEYYPAALEAFQDWCAPSAWAFVERFPTPQSLVQAGKSLLKLGSFQRCARKELPWSMRMEI